MVGNYVARFYQFAVVSVRELQDSLQDKFDRGVSEIEASVMHLLEAKSGKDAGESHVILSSYNSSPPCKYTLLTFQIIGSLNT